MNKHAYETPELKVYGDLQQLTLQEAGPYDDNPTPTGNAPSGFGTFTPPGGGGCGPREVC